MAGDAVGAAPSKKSSGRLAWVRFSVAGEALLPKVSDALCRRRYGVRIVTGGAPKLVAAGLLAAALGEALDVAGGFYSGIAVAGQHEVVGVGGKEIAGAEGGQRLAELLDTDLAR